MSSLIPTTSYITLSNGVEIFFREAGDVTKSTFLLLHGFPTSSIMFRNLITVLAPHFHLIAPDLPGFGFTIVPEGFEYSFASITDTVDLFVEKFNLKTFAIYIFDYGAPVGLRLALKNPHQISGIVSQNGNAYEEGLEDRFWGPLKKYWAAEKSNPNFFNAFKAFIEDPKNIKDQYTIGLKNPFTVDPTPIYLDTFLISRPQQTEIQVGLFYDYRTNIDLYSNFQEYFRISNVPILAVWGKNDCIFSPDGAEAFKKDSKNVKVKLYPTGHFALEEFANEIGKEIIDFFKPILI